MKKIELFCRISGTSRNLRTMSSVIFNKFVKSEIAELVEMFLLISRSLWLVALRFYCIISLEAEYLSFTSQSNVYPNTVQLTMNIKRFEDLPLVWLVSLIWTVFSLLSCEQCTWKPVVV